MTPLSPDDFPVTERYVYLNHAGLGPLSRPAFDAMNAAARSAMEEAAVGNAAWFDRLDDVRRSAGTVYGVDPADLAFVKNTTEGLAFVALGMTWSPGDRVLLPVGAFPSVRHPFEPLADRGVDVVDVGPAGPFGQPPLEAWDAALRAGGARLVVASWVHYARGGRLDLAALADLAHEHGALLCVDAIQGLGAVPARMADWDVDIATGDGHKWLLGPEGAGLLYVAPHRRAEIRPSEPGWASVASRGDFDVADLVWHDSARRYEGGTHNLAGLTALGASLDLVLAAGTERIWAHIDALTAHAAAGLADLGATVSRPDAETERSGILSFTIDGTDPVALDDGLRAAGVVGAARAGVVRWAPHAYIDREAIDTALATLARLIQRP